MLVALILFALSGEHEPFATSIFIIPYLHQYAHIHLQLCIYYVFVHYIFKQPRICFGCTGVDATLPRWDRPVPGVCCVLVW